MPKKTLPIFCDDCSGLALAELENAVLCLSCLLDNLNASTDIGVAEKILPLQMIPPQNHSAAPQDPANPETVQHLSLETALADYHY